MKCHLLLVIAVIFIAIGSYELGQSRADKALYRKGVCDMARIAAKGTRKAPEVEDICSRYGLPVAFQQ